MDNAKDDAFSGKTYKAQTFGLHLQLGASNSYHVVQLCDSVHSTVFVCLLNCFCAMQVPLLANVHALSVDSMCQISMWAHTPVKFLFCPYKLKPDS